MRLFTSLRDLKLLFSSRLFSWSWCLFGNDIDNNIVDLSPKLVKINPQLMRVFILCLLISSIIFNSKAQVTTRSHSIDQEFSIQYENDIVFFTDQYYTSGADINYALLLKRKSSFYKLFRSPTSDSSKVIFRFNFCDYNLGGFIPLD